MQKPKCTPGTRAGRIVRLVKLVPRRAAARMRLSGGQNIDQITRSAYRMDIPFSRTRLSVSRRSYAPFGSDESSSRGSFSRWTKGVDEESVKKKRTSHGLWRMYYDYPFESLEKRNRYFGF